MTYYKSSDRMKALEMYVFQLKWTLEQIHDFMKKAKTKTKKERYRKLFRERSRELDSVIRVRKRLKERNKLQDWKPIPLSSVRITKEDGEDIDEILAKNLPEPERHICVPSRAKRGHKKVRR